MENKKRELTFWIITTGALIMLTPPLLIIFAYIVWLSIDAIILFLMFSAHDVSFLKMPENIANMLFFGAMNTILVTLPLGFLIFIIGIVTDRFLSKKAKGS